MCLFYFALLYVYRKIFLQSRTNPFYYKTINRFFLEKYRKLFNFILIYFLYIRYIEMNRLPEIEMAEDLEIVSQEDMPTESNEDLTADPFIRAPPLTQFNKVEPKKAKRAVSEKQKAHLANARKLAKERKLEIKKQQEQAEQNELEQKKEKEKKVVAEVYEKQVDIGPPPLENNFNEFMENMDRYANLMKLHNEKEAIKKAEEELKEAKLEEKYFKKFQALKQQTEPPTRKTVPQSNLDILNKSQNEYGVYSNYF